MQEIETRMSGKRKRKRDESESDPEEDQDGSALNEDDSNDSEYGIQKKRGDWCDVILERRRCPRTLTSLLSPRSPGCFVEIFIH